MTKKNEELNRQLADLGVRQFVRITAIDVLRRHVGKKHGKSVDDVIKEMNQLIATRFKVIANNEFSKLLGELSMLMEKDEKDNQDN